MELKPLTLNNEEIMQHIVLPSPLSNNCVDSDFCFAKQTSIGRIKNGTERSLRIISSYPPAEEVKTNNKKLEPP